MSDRTRPNSAKSAKSATKMAAAAAQASTPGAAATASPRQTSPTYRISELLNKIQNALDVSIPDEVWVTGEISGWREPSHMTYFTLAEPKPQGRGFTATLSVVIFPRERYKIDAILRRNAASAITLEDGISVRIKGRLAIYPPQGRLQLRMTNIDPSFTIGRLALEKMRLLKALRTEGLLERNKAQRLEPLPLRVGLISSYDSAAFNDVVKQLSESGFGWQVTPINIFVQGSRSERSIVRAFSYVSRRAFDVIILARGGGSATDLATFDSEGVARAIAASPVPVFTGIGHEIDRSVADEVAHTACKTPTACAQALIDRVCYFDAQCAQLWEHIAGCAQAQLKDNREELWMIGREVQQAPRQSIALASQFLGGTTRRLTLATTGKLAGNKTFLSDVPNRLERATRGPLRNSKQQLAGLTDRLETAASNAVDRRTGQLAGIEARLKALDPAKILARGWSITRKADGSVLRSATAVQTGDELTTQLADGEVISSATASRHYISNTDPHASNQQHDNQETEKRRHDV